MNDVQSAPPLSDSQRFVKLPSALAAYANDIDKFGAPVDSGLSEILRFLSQQIPIERNHAQRLADALNGLLYSKFEQQAFETAREALAQYNEGK